MFLFLMRNSNLQCCQLLLFNLLILGLMEKWQISTIKFSKVRLKNDTEPDEWFLLDIGFSRHGFY